MPTSLSGLEYTNTKYVNITTTFNNLKTTYFIDINSIVPYLIKLIHTYGMVDFI